MVRDVWCELSGRPCRGVRFQYSPQVVEELQRHGVRPTPATRPELVHEFVNDLYRFELRRLRKRQVRGEIEKRDYSEHVVALRKKYILVSVPVQRWATSQLEREDGAAGDARDPGQQTSG